MNTAMWITAALAGLAGGGALLWYLLRHRTPTLSRPPGVEFQGAIRAIREGHYPEFEKILVDIPGLSKRDIAAEGNDATQPAAVQAPAAAATGEAQPSAKPDKDDNGIPPTHIFREYDVRGLAHTELTPHGMRWIGSAIGTMIRRQGRNVVMIGRDDRSSGVELSKSLAKGLMLSGMNIINIGKAATPMLYLAQHKHQVPDGLMLTASHNGPEYNGLKIVINNKPLYGKHIRAIYEHIRKGDIDLAGQHGNLRNVSCFEGYIKGVLEVCKPVETGFKVVVDCANGMAGPYLPFILRKLGHEVEELYCEVDGSFPNHLPDPTKEDNLESLAAAVQEHKADIGLALDGDADRLVAMDANGKVVWPDQLMMLFTRDLLERKPGATIVHDVKCTRHLSRLITELGGKPVMSACGHSVIRIRMSELDALLGGEFSGHVFFRERWFGFDDAIYASCRLLELLAQTGKQPTEVFNALPATHISPEYRVEMPTPNANELVENLSKHYPDAIRIDGLRVEYPDRWGVVRPSNTSPILSMRFEGDTPEALANIQEEFRRHLNTHAPGLALPF